ncbi:unnamed protein product, partial [marine sediment metagenome]
MKNSDIDKMCFDHLRAMSLNLFDNYDSDRGVWTNTLASTEAGLRGMINSAPGSVLKTFLKHVVGEPAVTFARREVQPERIGRPLAMGNVVPGTYLGLHIVLMDEASEAMREDVAASKA